MRSTLVAVIACCVVGAGVGGALVGRPVGGAALAQGAARAADEVVVGLLQEDLDAQRRGDPVRSSVRGDRRFDRLLPDVTPEGVAAQQRGDEERLARLLAVDRGALTAENRLNAALLEYVLRDRIAGARFRPEQIALTQQEGPQVSLPQMPDVISFTTEQHLEDYLARLEAVQGYIEATIANMRAGVKSGRTPPKVILRGVVEQVTGLLSMDFVANPKSHPMYRPFLSRPAGDPMAARAQMVIRDGVTPAFLKLRDFLRDEYVPGCRETLAATDLPDGAAFYEYLVRSHTTTEMTAQEVHALGLAEVARIRAEMFEAIARSDFARRDELEGDSLFAAFVEYLRTDKRFYHETPEALLTGYRDICKRMDAELPRLFGRLPRLPYGVREMPGFFAKAAPTAYYYPGSLENGVSGTFIANTYALDQRPKYEMTALALHEAVPGHHLQIALAQELEDAGLHEWRTALGFTVFVEGWGLYSERLGLEVGGAPGSKGMYEDPYDDFGRLTYEMWRAMRLVVDTGMHALGWTRQQAIDYMLANSALSRGNIESEVDRYIASPGQALGYKIGELRIREMRAEAERRLGEKFDVRAFHDALLGSGALPLSVLEAQMEEWVGMREAQRGGNGQ